MLSMEPDREVEHLRKRLSALENELAGVTAQLTKTKYKFETL